MKAQWFFAVPLAIAVSACSTTPAPAPASPTSAAGATCTGATAPGCGPELSPVASTQPARVKAVAHLREHVKYPARRADVLAACANTPEFADGEKRWMSDHLPNGTYASADDVVKALDW